MRRLLTTLAAVATLCACLAAVPAQGRAATGATVVRDCIANGTVTGTYTRGELKQGLAALPTDVDEYTDCAREIRAAMLAVSTPAAKRSSNGGGPGDNGLGGGPGGGPGGTGTGTGGGPGGVNGGLGAGPGGGGQGAHGGSGGASGGAAGNGLGTSMGPDNTVRVGGKTITPGAANGAGTVGASLPTPLLIALILIGVGAIGAGTLAAREHLLSRREA